MTMDINYCNLQFNELHVSCIEIFRATQLSLCRFLESSCSNECHENQQNFLSRILFLTCRFQFVNRRWRGRLDYLQRTTLKDQLHPDKDYKSTYVRVKIVEEQNYGRSRRSQDIIVFVDEIRICSIHYWWVAHEYLIVIKILMCAEIRKV